jgi:hypothetical protein
MLNERQEEPSSGRAVVSAALVSLVTGHWSLVTGRWRSETK